MKSDRFHRDDDEHDEEYKRYLWGEPTGKGFARSQRRGARRARRALAVDLDPSLDPARFVPR